MKLWALRYRCDGSIEAFRWLAKLPVRHAFFPHGHSAALATMKNMLKKGTSRAESMKAKRQ